MDIIIKSVNFKPAFRLEQFIREKISKLFNQSATIIRADVILRKNEDNNPENKLCEIRLIVPGYDHFVAKTTEAYEKSVLEAVKILQKLLRRKKGKLIAKRYYN